MQQRIHYIITILLLGAVSFLLLRTQTSKIAYVDSVKLLSEYQGMKDAKKAYSKKAAIWQSSVDTLSNDVRKSIQAYERISVGGSIKEKSLAKQLISVKQKQLIDYQKYLQKIAQGEDVKQTSAVLKTVNEFIYKYGKEKKYDIIFTTGQSGSLAYADTKLDITVEVVHALNEAYPNQ